MQRSLMIGITEKDMQAVVNTYDLNPYYYPTLFPLKENYTMTWKALETQVGLKIAGDLVARGASINKKTREAIARIQGDIPKVAIKRTKDENERRQHVILDLERAHALHRGNLVFRNDDGDFISVVPHMPV